MNTGSRPLRVFEAICQELLGRLQADTSETAQWYSRQARDFLATLGSWEHEVPTQDQRAAIIAQILDLHRTVMEYLTVHLTKHTPT